MPLPVIADVVQLKMIFTGSPLQRPASVATYWLDTAAQPVSALLTDADASALSGMWNMVSSNVGVTKLTATPLDGISASEDLAIAAFPAKWTGSGGADAIPQGAAVVSFKSALRGPRWRNRIYLPAIAEGAQTDGLLGSTFVANATTAWTSFRTAMAAAGWQQHVVSPFSSSAVPVTATLVRPNLRSQRRRSRR
jgi:hypothetical protein